MTPLLNSCFKNLPFSQSVTTGPDLVNAAPPLLLLATQSSRVNHLTQILYPVWSGVVEALLVGQPHREFSSLTNPSRNIPSGKVHASEMPPPSTFPQRKQATLPCQPCPVPPSTITPANLLQHDKDLLPSALQPEMWSWPRPKRAPHHWTWLSTSRRWSGSEQESSNELALLSFSAEEVRVFALHTGGGGLEISK